MNKPNFIEIKKIGNNECEVTFHGHSGNVEYEFEGKKKKHIRRFRKQIYGIFERNNKIQLVKKIK